MHSNKTERMILTFDFIFLAISISGLLLILNNYTFREIENMISDWNHQWTRLWFGLLIIYWLELFLLALFWDLLWYRLDSVISFIYNRLTHRVINNKKWLVKIVRIKYGFNKLCYHVRPGIIRTSYRDHDKLINFIVAPTPFDIIKAVFFAMFGIIMILSIILATYDNNFFVQIWIEVKRLWIEERSFIWDNFSKLSSIVILPLVLFLWYFISSKGIIRRSIAAANRKKLEDIIQLHRKLANPIARIINKGSKNIEYAINCRSSIIDYWLFKKYPYAYELGLTSYIEDRWYSKDHNYFLFEDILEITELVSEIEILQSTENKEMTYWFSRYQYELINFNIKMITTDIKKYEELMFTAKGFKKIIEIKENEHEKRIKKVIGQASKQKIQEQRKIFEQYILNDNIIRGVEMLYMLYRYIQVLDSVFGN